MIELSSKYPAACGGVLYYQNSLTSKVNESKNVESGFKVIQSEYSKNRESLYELEVMIGDILVQAAGLSDKEKAKLADWTSRMRPVDPLWPGLDKENQVCLTDSFLASSIVSEIVGILFGRWVPYGVASISVKPCFKLDISTIYSPSLINRKSAYLGNPHDIAWMPKDVFVDDRSSLADMETCFAEFLAMLYGEHAGEFESALIYGLKTQTIRSYLSSPNGFFADHLKRYTKSRREAPIYWPLTTPSGSYTLWVYYPRLSNQTLYTTINDFIEPKLKLVAAEAKALRNKGITRSSDDEKQFESQQLFELELIELRDTLLKLAPTYKPNLDDGVQISAAPLWLLFRHKPWQKVLKETWDKLEKGDYDWAHLAMNYWPERVRLKCKTDKSLAIAHGLEELYIEPLGKVKKVRNKKNAGVDK